jgi:hypothetical protein
MSGRIRGRKGDMDLTRGADAAKDTEAPRERVDCQRTGKRGYPSYIVLGKCGLVTC